MSQTLANPFAALAVELGIGVLVKGTVILGVAGLVTWLLRESSAAKRHAVWSFTLGSLLILPILSVVLPAWRAEPIYVTVAPDMGAISEVPSHDDERAVSRQPAAASRIGEVGVPSPGIEALAAEERVVRPKSAGLPAGIIALLIWTAGVVVVLGRLALAAVRVHRITRRAWDCRLADVRDAAEELAHHMRIERRIRILVSDEVSVPLSWGVLAPVVIFPEAATTWSTERRRIVLMHEMAHIARWDYDVHLMTEIACAVYWFNPLVWLAARLSAMERERACDDRALHLGIRSDIYAGHLCDIARAQLMGAPLRAAFAMAQPSGLGRRVRSILTEGLDRAPVSQRGLLSTAVVALAIALPLATVELWGVAPDGEQGLWQRIQDRISPPQEFVQERDPVARRIRELQHRDPQVRRHAAWALGEMESAKGVDPLIDRLRDDNADVRLAAAWALGEIKEHTAIVPLTELLEDDDPLVREMAVLALGEIEHPSAVAPLLEALRQHEDLWRPAVWAFGEIGGRRAQSARDALLDEMGQGHWDNDEVWTGNLGSDEARSLARDQSSLAAALRDESPRIRRSAAEWLGIRGDESAVDALLDTLRDPEPTVRAMAIWALDEINPSRRRWR